MWDEEIEKAVLYYVIFEHEEFILDENDFMSARNKKIIRAINELKAKKEEVSILQISSKIQADKNQVLKYLSSLSEYIKTTANANIPLINS